MSLLTARPECAFAFGVWRTLPGDRSAGPKSRLVCERASAGWASLTAAQDTAGHDLLCFCREPEEVRHEDEGRACELDMARIPAYL